MFSILSHYLIIQYTTKLFSQRKQLQNNGTWNIVRGNIYKR